MPHETSAGFIVFHDEEKREYLILHYEEGHWDFPKGHLEEGESLFEAAARETREETGLEPKYIKGFKEDLSYFYKRSGKTWHKTVYFFLAESHTSDVTLSHEHIGFAWLPYEKALDKLTYDNAKDMLKKAQDFLDSVS